MDVLSLLNAEIHPVHDLLGFMTSREEGALGGQSCSYKLFQGDSLFVGGITHGTLKDHGPERDTSP